VVSTIDGERRVTGVVTSDERTIPCDYVVETSGRRSRIMEMDRTRGLRQAVRRSDRIRNYVLQPLFPVQPGREHAARPYPSAERDLAVRSLHDESHRSRNVQSDSLHCALACRIQGATARSRLHEFYALDARVADWLDPSKSFPIWRVEPFGALINRYRRFTDNGKPMVPGLYIIGDARFHTNPIYGWGVAFALHQSYVLADAFTVTVRQSNGRQNSRTNLTRSHANITKRLPAKTPHGSSCGKAKKPDSDRRRARQLSPSSHDHCTYGVQGSGYLPQRHAEIAPA